MRKRLGFLLVCGATFIGAIGAARAQPPGVFCDGATPIVVIGPKKGSSELVKQLTEGGGMAGLGVKSYGITNTLEVGEALQFLRRYVPQAATEEAAEALTTFARSGFAKAGALTVAAVGGYLVYEGIFGDHELSTTEVPPGVRYGWKPVGSLVPCDGSLARWANSYASGHIPEIDAPLPHTWQIPVTHRVSPAQPGLRIQSSAPANPDGLLSRLSHKTPPATVSTDPFSSFGASLHQRSTAPATSPLLRDLYNYSGEPNSSPEATTSRPDPLWQVLHPSGNNSQ